MIVGLEYLERGEFPLSFNTFFSWFGSAPCFGGILDLPLVYGIWLSCLCTGFESQADSLVKPYFQTEEDKLPSRKKNSTPPEIAEVEDSPGPVKKIIKARSISLNGKDQRQYLVRLKSQTAYTDKWLAVDAIQDGNLHLRRFRASRSTEKSHQ
ncbi:hypothetical protein O181_008280 [Austropuccinia psidii MF-1]|uniref:Chromo domain-containing protein n=1 Tax=Austropuccinia psidii MF-1 TaxID=1389203 RepID=A0A9Q3GIR1_9BASI|nr:hypothetical protein [Austropuccinia psidii MF-1]